jgi:hypothetical protein
VAARLAYWSLASNWTIVDLREVFSSLSLSSYCLVLAA